MNKHGRKWIADKKRLALYLRDGLCCQWCGKGIETEGVTLTLDHYRAREKGGDNQAKNLFTACNTCNSHRQHKTVAAFAENWNEPKAVVARINRTRRRSIYRFLAQADDLISARGGFTAALRSQRQA